MSAAIPLETVDLPRDENGPVFDYPWQAQAFALTVELHKAGRFSWPEWVEVFSEEIKASPARPGESVNDAYYRQWMAALETMVSSRNLLDRDGLAARKEEWKQAYLNTPHGQPILLANAACPPAHDHHHHDHNHDHDGHHHHAPARKPVAVSAALT